MVGLQTLTKEHAKLTTLLQVWDKSLSSCPYHTQCQLTNVATKPIMIWCWNWWGFQVTCSWPCPTMLEASVRQYSDWKVQQASQQLKIVISKAWKKKNCIWVFMNLTLNQLHPQFTAKRPKTAVNENQCENQISSETCRASFDFQMEAYTNLPLKNHHPLCYWPINNLLQRPQAVSDYKFSVCTFLTSCGIMLH